MQWCQKHWDALRAEVKLQGLESLVPDSGEKAAAIMTRQLEGEESLDAFDPLMGAMWAVNAFIGEAMGPGGMLAVFTLDGCPVCKFDEVHMATCRDDRHAKPCTVSIDWCFVNAVEDQRHAWEAMRS